MRVHECFLLALSAHTPANNLTSCMFLICVTQTSGMFLIGVFYTRDFRCVPHLPRSGVSHARKIAAPLTSHDSRNGPQRTHHRVRQVPRVIFSNESFYIDRGRFDRCLDEIWRRLASQRRRCAMFSARHVWKQSFFASSHDFAFSSRDSRNITASSAPRSPRSRRCSSAHS